MNKIVIGEIDFSNTERIRDYTICRIEVRDEGLGKDYINNNHDLPPHFHIVNDEKDFDCQIRIYENCYYFEPSYDPILDRCRDDWFYDSQFPIINNWLNEYNTKYNMSNWEAIDKVWKELNPNFIYREYEERNHIKPDYTKFYEHQLDNINIGIIDFGGDIGKCSIRVKGKHNKIPHFHIVALNCSLYCGVRIYDNHFYSHKGQHTDILNKEQCEILDKWLEDTHKNIKYRTNWEEIVSTWENSNFGCKFRKKMMCKTKPDYSNMDSFLETVK